MSKNTWVLLANAMAAAVSAVLGFRSCIRLGDEISSDATKLIGGKKK